MSGTDALTGLYNRRRFCMEYDRLLEQAGGVFYIDYDGVYVGIERMVIDTKELLNIIRSIE